MATIWLSYAWEDNKNQDVDFAAQELVKFGLGVKLDRWNIGAGRRLWEQIEEFILDPKQSDAWLLYATQASLGSEPCKEEFAYALERALKSRGGEFPVIGLFPASVDDALIPAGIKTRLYVSLRDPDWKERIKAAADGRPAIIARPPIDPYQMTMRRPSSDTFALELRPRGGTWIPFLAAIPASEQEQVYLQIRHGPAGRLPSGVSAMSNVMRGVSQDGRWQFVTVGMEATPTMSFHLFFHALPSILVFGVDAGTQYTVNRETLIALPFAP